MGALAAAFDKKGTDAPSKVQTMLREMDHRAAMPPRVVSQPSTFIAQHLGNLSEETFSKAAAGTNNSEPILGTNYIWILEGQFFPPSQGSAVHHFMDKLGHQPMKIATQILTNLEGAYTFAVTLPDRVLVGRDATGTKPLYYGENESTCAIATERKALWKIGIATTHSFPPGNLAIMNEKGFVFQQVSTLKPPAQRKIAMNAAARQLQKLLYQSTRDRVSDTEKVAVAFSGGIDSSLIAVLAKKAEAKPHLMCVGLEGQGQSEIEQAKETSQALSLPFTLQTHSIEDVEKALPKVLWLIEEPDVMKAGVAIPFFWTAEAASNLGHRILLAGQGADELFGGYSRYLTAYAKKGSGKVREAMFHDTVLSYETNFQRDEPVCAYHGIDLRLPFADTRVVRYALSLPLTLKLESKQDNLRKRVLRQTAKNLGIPDSISDKPKKAIQFASGVDKALKILARKEGLTQRAYIEDVFSKVYPNKE